MCLWLLATAAFAQDTPTPALAPASVAHEAPAPRAPVFDDDQDVSVIVGEFLKPDITVIISRENLNKAYDLHLDESFLDKIVESVHRPPF